MAGWFAFLFIFLFTFIIFLFIQQKFLMTEVTLLSIGEQQ